MSKHQGCCADKSCTEKTCMNLPEGKTCGDCVHIYRCSRIFGGDMKSFTPIQKIGDTWHRVDGQWIDDGSETYQGMELGWTTWVIVKVTRSGAWLRCDEWPWKKQRFALIPGARWTSATRKEALQQLIARKKRHLSILSQQEICAKETLELAIAALAKAEGKS